MSEIIDIITRLQYIAADEGLKKSSQMIVQQTNEVVQLTAKRVQLGQQQEQLSAKDVAGQKRIFAEIQKVETAIKSKTKAILSERLASADLNKELVKEVGYLTNLESKLQAIKTKRAMATTAAEVRGLTKDLNVLEAELKSITATSGKGGGLMGGQLLAGLTGGILGGGITALLLTGIQSIKSFVSASIDEFEDAEESARKLSLALEAVGKPEYFDGLIEEATVLADKFHNLFDNDDIIKAQTELVKYGNYTRAEMSKITEVVINLAAKLDIDLVSAANRVVDVMAGRGAATLRDFGLKVKDAKTDTERLNLVLVDLAGAVDGAADSLAKSTKGIEQINSEMLKKIEEDFGKAFSRIKRAVLPIITEILNQISLGFSSIDDLVKEIEDNANKKSTQRYLEQFGGRSKNQLLQEREYNKQRVKEADSVKRELDKIDDQTPSSVFGAKQSGKLYGSDLAALLIRRSLLKQQFDEITDDVINSNIAINKLLVTGGTDKRKINPNASVTDATPKKDKKGKTAEQLAEELRKYQEKLAAEFESRTEKEFADAQKNLSYYNERELLALEKLKDTEGITEQEYQTESLAREEQYLIEQIIIFKDYAKDVSKLELELAKKRQQIREDYRKNKIIPPVVSGESLPGSAIPGGEGVDISGMSPSALETDLFIENAKELSEQKDIQDKEDDERRKIRNQKIVEGFEATNSVIQAAGDALNQFNYSQIQSLDLAISVQERRMESAKKYAERGGAELLEIEQERLDKMIQKREEAARRTLIINQALALSESIVAVATAAAAGGGYASVALVAAVIAAIASGYAIVKTLADPVELAEGKIGIDGPGNETSDSIPARLSKGESVITAEKTRKFNQVLTDIHEGKYSSEEDMYRQIASRQFAYKSLIDARQTNTTTTDRKLLLSIGDKLDGVTDAINDKPVSGIYADERGLSTYMIKMQQVTMKRNKY